MYLLEARDGTPPLHELEAMAKQKGANIPVLKELMAKAPLTAAPRKLLPCIYPRMHFLGLFMVEISGIVFFLPPGLRRKVAGRTLDVGRGALVLIDQTGRIVMPTEDRPPASS